MNYLGRAEGGVGTNGCRVACITCHYIPDHKVRHLFLTYHVQYVGDVPQAEAPQGVLFAFGGGRDTPQIFLESDKVFKTLLGEKKQYLFKIAKQVMHNAFFSL